MRARTIDRAAICLAVAMGALVLLATWARARADGEELDRPDGRKTPGRIAGDARSGFRFAPADGGASIALEPGMTIRGAARGPETAADPPAPTPAIPPPFHLLVGESARLSGALAR